jgi:hypothetical protein
MCGDLKPGQHAKTVTAHVTTSASNVTISLPYMAERVEEVWLDEYLVVGASANVGYLDVKAPGLNFFAVNNENAPGTAIALSSGGTQEHWSYDKSRVLSVGQFVNIQQFQLNLQTAAGAAVTFTEALFVFTFVMRDDPRKVAEYRQNQASLDLPSIKGVDPRTQSARSGLF